MMKSFLYSIFGGVAFLFLYGCVQVKPNQLYISNGQLADTSFYISSEIYKDYITSEGWVTQSKSCVEAKTSSLAAYQGDLGIELTWNKQAGGCPWLGFGFGWDSWTGKDLTRVKNTGAIEFYVRTLEGEKTNLPWAIGLEDFSDAQAWLGMSPNCIEGGVITTEWTRVKLPLSEFNWEEQGADASNIKQIIFNLEGEGHVLIDEISIVPYTGGYRKRAEVYELLPNSYQLDGDTNDALWQTPALKVKDNQVHLAYSQEQLLVGLLVRDTTPLINTFHGADLFNGDAFEIAFSTNAQANVRRTMYSSSDHHIGFGFNNDSMEGWDWKNEKSISIAQHSVKKIEGGYIIEMAIDLNTLALKPMQVGELYGLELAIDVGDENGRLYQARWNDPANNGFYMNPSLWGEMILMPPKTMNP